MKITLKLLETNLLRPKPMQIDRIYFNSLSKKNLNVIKRDCGYIVKNLSTLLNIV